MLNRLALTGQADRISGARVKKRKSCILWAVKSVRGGGAAAGGGTITGHGGQGTRVADVAPARGDGRKPVVVVKSLAKARTIDRYLGFGNKVLASDPNQER